MALYGWRLNRFERTLFWIALGIGAVLVFVRVAAVFVVSYLRYTR
jgi:hypothetical protein